MLQYWAPCARKGGLTDAEAYADCWKGFWTENKADLQVWEDADAIVWSWRPKKPGPYTRIKIPTREAKKAQEGIHIGVAQHPNIENELDNEAQED